MTIPRIPPPPGYDIETGPRPLTGRRMLLSILGYAAALGLFIGSSFAASAWIAPWAGIVLPIGGLCVVLAAVFVWVATKEQGWK